MSDELKPVRCGCGGEAVVIHATDKVMIWCNGCGLESRLYDTEAEAVEAWNRAMSGNAQDCAENARCSETAKVSKGAYDLMRCECGMPVSSNFDFCPRCRARLEWK